MQFIFAVSFYEGNGTENNSIYILDLDRSDSLTIQSPNFPERYPNYANMTWIVLGVDGDNIVATFKEFSLESGYDFLTIGSGEDPTDDNTRLARLTGNGLPEDVVSGTSEMWLRFTSDYSVRDEGFWIEVSLRNQSGRMALLRV